MLQLATRLRVDGIGVRLDRWDTDLGSDLSLFVECLADTKYRVVANCTTRYVMKADSAQGGVWYKDDHSEPYAPSFKRRWVEDCREWLGQHVIEGYGQGNASTQIVSEEFDVIKSTVLRILSS